MWILEAELAYDTRNWKKLEDLSPDCVPLLRALADRDYEKVYSLAEKLFLATKNPWERAFYLQWAVAATENQGHMRLRGSWLLLWNEIEGWAEHSYCCYLKNFHEGITAFSAASLQDAERRFRQCLEISLESGYERGAMRALFHLGLVDRDIERYDECLEYFQLALERAKTLKTELFAKRVEGEIAVLAKTTAATTGLSAKIAELERLLAMEDWSAVRTCLVEAELLRRRERLGRNFRRLALYLVPLFVARGKSASARNILRTLRDPMIRIKALTLWSRIKKLSSAEESELLALRKAHGIATNIEKFSLDPMLSTVCGISIREITDESIQKLMLLMIIKKEPVQKEEICRAVWGNTYDPTIHDNKIYKLFHRARKYFHTPDLLTNHYGSYSLNAKSSSNKSTKRKIS